MSVRVGRPTSDSLRTGDRLGFRRTNAASPLGKLSLLPQGRDVGVGALGRARGAAGLPGACLGWDRSPYRNSAVETGRLSLVFRQLKRLLAELRGFEPLTLGYQSSALATELHFQGRRATHRAVFPHNTRFLTKPGPSHRHTGSPLPGEAAPAGFSESKPQRPGPNVSNESNSPKRGLPVGVKL